MIPIYEFNRLVVLVATLPLEKKKTISEITVSDAIDGLAIFANNINPKEIIQNSIDFGLISRHGDRISLTNKGNNLLKLQIIQDDDAIVDALIEEQQKFFVELIFNLQNLKTDLQNIFDYFRIHHNKKIWFYNSEKIHESWNTELVDCLDSCNFWNIIDDKREVRQLYNKQISKIKKRAPVTQQH